MNASTPTSTRRSTPCPRCSSAQHCAIFHRARKAWASRLFDHHHVQAQRSATRGDLGADETASDDDDARPRAESFSDCQAVLDRAKQHHAIGDRAARPFARDRAAGDDESVEWHGLFIAVVAQVNGARRQVQSHGRSPSQHPCIDVKARRQVDTCPVYLTGEQLLGKGRPVVRRVPFITDDCQGTVITVLSQSLGCTCSRHACTDDHYLLERKSSAWTQSSTADRLRRTGHARRPSPWCATFTWVLLLQVKKTIIVQFENLMADAHADGIPIAGVKVHRNLHLRLHFSRRPSAGNRSGRA